MGQNKWKINVLENGNLLHVEQSTAWNILKLTGQSNTGEIYSREQPCWIDKKGLSMSNVLSRKVPFQDLL